MLCNTIIAQLANVEIIQFGSHAYGLSMFMVGTAAAVLQTLPMFWIILVTYNEKSVIVIMLKKVVDMQSGDIERKRTEDSVRKAVNVLNHRSMASFNRLSTLT